MLKRLLELMGEAEEACRRAIGQEISSPGTCEKPTREAYERATEDPDCMDFGVVYTYAILEGIPEESAFVIGSAYASMIAEGTSKAYAIFYAAAFSVACTLIGASEQWARAYAMACARMRSQVRESMGFAGRLRARRRGRSVAGGCARAFARRYAV